jgi:hypothetical protein
MTPNPSETPGVEPDSRFPSGRWTGFFLEPPLPGKHWMELILTFRNGIMEGEGRDRVGEFLIKGRYQVDDGKCWWTKNYIKKHSIVYHGYNEGRGIWGTWEYNPQHKGGFHIWPEAMGDPTQIRLAEAVEEPVEAPPLEIPIVDPMETAEPVGAPAEVAEPAISRNSAQATSSTIDLPIASVVVTSRNGTSICTNATKTASSIESSLGS